ncbi:MAG: DUF5063 domain-containing protein [Candidatus Cybelea sp.]
MTTRNDITGIASAFASQAERYVRWLDRVVTDEVSVVDMRELHELLGELQAAGARLPAVAPGEEADRETQYKRVGARDVRPKLPIDPYSVVFNPLEYDSREVNPPKPVMATLADDLGDIYADLMEGLALYREGQCQNAMWHWRFLYYAHWGRHLSHAQSAIWQYLSEGNPA